MIQAIKSQVAFAMKQKAAILTFYLLLTLVLLNFTTNVFAFQGSDVIEMYHPAKMLVLSYNRNILQCRYDAFACAIISSHRGLSSWLYAHFRKKQEDRYAADRPYGKQEILCEQDSSQLYSNLAHVRDPTVDRIGAELHIIPHSCYRRFYQFESVQSALC